MDKPREKRAAFFDIKRFALHDGPGMRTTFFMQGCPLRCCWCHNPEGMAVFDPDACRPQENCLELLDPAELLREAARDRVFMEESQGGITFSGGEPLLQPQYLRAACKLLKAEDFHIAIDTCGYADRSVFEMIEPFVDLYLYDLKIIDDQMHRKYTGASVAPILDNLDFLLAGTKPVWVRIPIVPGITDSRANLERIHAWLQKRDKCARLSLMPFHSGGSGKYERLGIDNMLAGTAPPSPERMRQLMGIFSDLGVETAIGG